MAQKLVVVDLNIGEADVNVLLEENELLKNSKITPEGRMLADSENVAFIYLLDVEDEFIYVSFPREIWVNLEKSYRQKLPLNIYIDEKTKVHLTEFHEELEYLISNIEENSNYGDNMVQAVSDIFKIK
ncbi:hypothetical protein DS745_18010 [Anaerobacillus alkaliphilus]|uniref:Uncharacterized protein n=1 Tax=Anaerobacillus alkaliphilus TaxID=1548597 RepID=A0A4Q0VQ47_9BACI|nr:hypothetical protein [Anaerobacillus alkaliphilus]RXI98231.1 hypothetical protein DS745_18010 [Anaerobacillus alkaliphilus]